MMNPSSIQDSITQGKSQAISHSRLHTKAKFINDHGDTVIMNYTSVFDKYYDIILANSRILSTTDTEYIKYRYRPKTLSQDLFDTVELWSLILKLNNLTSASEFTIRDIRVPNEAIFEIINEILILEEGELRANRIAIYGK